MSNQEYIEYILGYVKACKIKGDTYIGVYGNTLVCIDIMCSMVYIVQLEYPAQFAISNTSAMLSEGVYFNYHVANIISGALNHVLAAKPNLSPITKKNTDIPIPSSAGDNAKHQLYYYDNNPTKELLLYEFYNMMPLSKADSYIIEAARNPSFPSRNVITIRCTVYKKKPKCTIEIYRNILDLLGDK